MSIVNREQELRLSRISMEKALFSSYSLDPQRVSASLIITDATHVSPQGVGSPSTLGIHTHEHLRGWMVA